MKLKKIYLIAGCAMLLSLTGCRISSATGNAETAELKTGSISGHPKPALEANIAHSNSLGTEALLTPDETGAVYLRCADLTGADLSDQGDLLLNAEFDSHTKWPDSLPSGFDALKLMESGKDPGLGIRELHKKGITGKGIGIAIIDQTLPTDHIEYADRLKLYQEYHSAVGDISSLHGPAVASLALGKTVGTAPEALLYFIADDVGKTEGDQFVKDMSYYAKDVERLTALNKTLSDSEKIRIISISAGYLHDDLGAEEMDLAIKNANDAGIAVIMMNSRDPLMASFLGMGRTPYGDPNSLESCRPGQYLEESLFNGEIDTDSILIPMDRRTMATDTGTTDYTHIAIGGSSFKVPYIAGLYALACQVKPDVNFKEFVDAARETAQPVSVTHEGKDYPYGRVINPAALLKKLAPSAL